MQSRFFTKVLMCVLLCSLWAAAAPAATVNYKGKTSQKRNIKFSIAGKSLTHLRFSIILACSDGSTLTDDESDFRAIPIAATGKFSDKQFGDTDEVQVKGTKKGSKVTGTLRVTDKLNSSVKCGPRTVKFTAKRA
jgi:hypothetical protein